jgi:hypothetical protein
VGSNNSTVVKSLTMKTYVRAADLGHPRAPGNYRCDGDTVQVEQSHIDTWRDEPRAAFRAVYVGKGLDPVNIFPALKGGEDVNAYAKNPSGGQSSGSRLSEKVPTAC